jgi:hypothetical protein
MCYAQDDCFWLARRNGSVQQYRRSDLSLTGRSFPSLSPSVDHDGSVIGLGCQQSDLVMSCSSRGRFLCFQQSSSSDILDLVEVTGHSVNIITNNTNNNIITLIIIVIITCIIITLIITLIITCIVIVVILFVWSCCCCLIFNIRNIKNDIIKKQGMYPTSSQENFV